MDNTHTSTENPTGKLGTAPRHSPTPWYARVSRDQQFMEITDRNGDPVAKIPCGINNIDFRYGNTDLLKAAPDLLAACERAHDYLAIPHPAYIAKYPDAYVDSGPEIQSERDRVGTMLANAIAKTKAGAL